MNVAKISVNFPKNIKADLVDYLVSKGFSKTGKRSFTANINEKTLEICEKLNKRYENESEAIVKLYGQPRQETLEALRSACFKFNWSDKQWYGMKSSLTSEILEGLKDVASINYIE